MTSAYRTSQDLKWKTILKSLAIFLLAFILAACGSGDPQPADELPSDASIESAISDRLASSPFVTGEDSLVATAEDGVVTLTGTATSILAKEKATEISRAASGVLSVVNNVKVVSTRPDEAIAADITRALQTDPATEALEIVVGEVNNGVVTLKGAAESWQEKRLAGQVARGVKGVTAVRNNVLVNYVEARDDTQIEQEINQVLRFDSRLGSARINVDVRNDTVSLSGSVGSATEKHLASELAHVTGVEAVEADLLEVHPEYENSLFANEAASRLSSTDIEAAVNRALVYDPRVTADSITVSVSDGTATLTGTVEEIGAKLAAAADARNTAGVARVQNDIEVVRKIVVEPEVPTSDEAIRTRVKEAITRDPYVENSNVTVFVEEGLVALSGEVGSEFERSRIEQLAEKVKGVLAVTNSLSVNSGTHKGT